RADIRTWFPDSIVDDGEHPRSTGSRPPEDLSVERATDRAARLANQRQRPRQAVRLPPDQIQSTNFAACTDRPGQSDVGVERLEARRPEHGQRCTQYRQRCTQYGQAPCKAPARLGLVAVMAARVARAGWCFAATGQKPPRGPSRLRA